MLVLAVTLGCKKGANVVGKWSGPSGLSLTFNADKTFSQGGPMATTGTWSSSGNSVSVKITKMGGVSADEAITKAANSSNHPEMAGTMADALNTEYEVSDDGKTLTQTSGSLSISYAKDESK